MSMFFGPSPSDPALSGLPRGEVLGSYGSHAEARKLVDRLAEAEFDVRTVSIVGTDLRTVERIRNRLTYASVALRGALQGAFFGLLLGILMTLIDPSGAGVQVLYTVALGVAIWVLFGVIGHAIRKGRGFDSVQQLVPARFDVVCAFESAPRARQLLGGTGSASPVQSAVQHPVPTPAPPPPGAAGGPQGAPGAPADPPETSTTTAGPVSGQGSTAPADARQPAVTVPANDPDDASAASAAAGRPEDSAATKSSGVPAAEPTAVSPPAPARTHHFPDLPDGRPQFGVRLPEDEARALQERMLQDTAGRSGSGTGTFAVPEYGRGGRVRRQDTDRPVDGGRATGPASGSPAGEQRAAAEEQSAAAGEPGSAARGPASGTDAEQYVRPRYGRHSVQPGTSSADAAETGPGVPSGAGSSTGDRARSPVRNDD